MRTNEGHRQRVIDRFRKEGLDSFDEVHVLELLLYSIIPRKDTKDQARALLDRFGMLPQVLEATEQELRSVEGIGPKSALLLRLVTEVGRYYQTAKNKDPVILDTPEKYGRYLTSYFYGRRNETVYLLCMDAKHKVLGCLLVGEGDVNSASIPLRRMAEMALGVNATLAVLAHNHPSGFAVPSLEDRETTRQLATAFGAMDIVLLDHIVVADDDFVSMRESRLYDPKQFCRLI